ncbi:hypothetical protein [Gilvimarinus chinensis]|uniref:hypothetical protein n=1 Tax=Gilvimarinus chinensis TaxID=396005 RepID=UPI00036331BA|nr:hypothetical protein [Gilvimarinus chinensis]
MPSILLIVLLEAALALLVAGLLIYLYIRKLRRLIRRQQEQLRLSLERSAAHTEHQTPLEDQLKNTSKHFFSQAPEGDINTPTESLSPSAQLAAIHYHLLSHLGPEAAEGTWEQAGEKFLNLLNAEPNQDQALATAEKRIQNLEQFKKLFFEMEQQWETARLEAQHYYEQLMAMQDEVEDPAKFSALLNQYNSLYDDIHHSIIAATGSEPTSTSSVEPERITLTRADPRTADELNKLRNVAADQHRIINKLQQQLLDAKSAEEKEAVIQQLQDQLEQQLRYVKESETCVQLLESELEASTQKLNELESALNNTIDQQHEMDDMRATLHQFTLETKDLLNHIDSLEKENQVLRDSQQDAGQQDLQQRHSQLEAQYAELEERYLDLRSKG